MPLTTQQLQTLRDSIATNTTEISVGGAPPVAINMLSNTSDNNAAIADWYNQLASPNFWVWRTSVERRDIYNETSDTGSTWDWTVYKNQTTPEQNAWVQMFMGDAADFSKVNLRAGIGKIFTGSASANAQRDHCLAMGRRTATNAEKLFSVAVVNPPANTGNNASHAVGTTTNPGIMGYEQSVAAADVEEARNLA